MYHNMEKLLLILLLLTTAYPQSNMLLLMGDDGTNYTPPAGYEFFITSDGDTLKTSDSDYFLPKESMVYLMSSFAMEDTFAWGESVTWYEKLYISKSLDGKNWEYIDGLDSQFVYKDESGVDNIRDPSIMYYDGNFYVVYTAGSFGAAGYIKIIKSPDLLNWSLVAQPTTIDTADYSWAPEWFVDTNGQVNIMLTICPKFYGWGNGSTFIGFNLYLMTALTSSLTEWSVPVMLDGTVEDRIDGYVVKINDIYNLFYAKFYSNNEYIERTYSTTNLIGEYDSENITGDWAGWGMREEGGCIIKTEEDKYRIYFHHYALNSIDDTTAFKLYYSESSDTLQTWTTAEEVTGLYPQPAHGTVIRISKSKASVLN